jgi:chromosome segregation ATPase
MEVNKMAEETKEEKEAREAEEKRLADEEAAKKAADAKPPETPPAKDKGEELAGKDVTKFTPSEMVDYIDKLKDENARRRISNRTLKDSQAKMEKKLEEIEGQLGKATKTLSKVEEEKKASADAEKSEVERLKAEVNDFKTKLDDMEGRVQESDKAIAEKDLQIKKQSRESEIGNLLRAAKIQFSSDYERKGFLADLLKTDDDGDFTVNEEEVNYRVGQFIKKTKETKPAAPDTPGAGPTIRKGEPALGERIKALTDKAAKEGGLESTDQEELDELLDLAGQAAAWDPRTAG